MVVSLAFYAHRPQIRLELPLTGKAASLRAAAQSQFERCLDVAAAKELAGGKTPVPVEDVANWGPPDVVVREQRELSRAAASGSSRRALAPACECQLRSMRFRSTTPALRSQIAPGGKG